MYILLTVKIWHTICVFLYVHCVGLILLGFVASDNVKIHDNATTRAYSLPGGTLQGPGAVKVDFFSIASNKQQCI